MGVHVATSLEECERRWRQIRAPTFWPAAPISWWRSTSATGHQRSSPSTGARTAGLDGRGRDGAAGRRPTCTGCWAELAALVPPGRGGPHRRLAQIPTPARSAATSACSRRAMPCPCCRPSTPSWVASAGRRGEVSVHDFMVGGAHDPGTGELVVAAGPWSRLSGLRQGQVRNAMVISVTSACLVVDREADGAARPRCGRPTVVRAREPRRGWRADRRRPAATGRGRRLRPPSAPPPDRSTTTVHRRYRRHAVAVLTPACCTGPPRERALHPAGERAEHDATGVRGREPALRPARAPRPDGARGAGAGRVARARCWSTACSRARAWSWRPPPWTGRSPPSRPHRDGMSAVQQAFVDEGAVVRLLHAWPGRRRPRPLDRRPRPTTSKSEASRQPLPLRATAATRRRAGRRPARAVTTSSPPSARRDRRGPAGRRSPRCRAASPSPPTSAPTGCTGAPLRSPHLRPHRPARPSPAWRSRRRGRHHRR